MKFFSRFVLSTLFAAAALAQNVYIASPAAGSSVTPGSDITVEVSQPDGQSSWVESALVLGWWPCDGSSEDPCLPASEVLGELLYNGGPFKPTFYNTENVISQNITVNIPSSTPAGYALLQVAHFVLVGAELGPVVQTFSVNLTVV
ncbi:hypothetical protein MSAN_00215100 [Mycena sanguinolenta]|uniref:Uncharacterized protein n=1 Tax=Mycena sanguinolenta TaxID=230812 RepID=A0A8H6ZF81_9AGAR|nr:hypothetical protein MSAN_00215100 [Mycena sanguinolenta]